MLFSRMYMRFFFFAPLFSFSFSSFTLLPDNRQDVRAPSQIFYAQLLAALSCPSMKTPQSHPCTLIQLIKTI